LIETTAAGIPGMRGAMIRRESWQTLPAIAGIKLDG
jgi:hypothetical protein